MTPAARRRIWIIVAAVVMVAAWFGVGVLRKSQPNVAPRADLQNIEKQLNVKLRVPPPSEARVVSARMTSVRETSSFHREAALIVVKWRGHNLVLRQGYPNPEWSVTGEEPKVPWTLEAAINRPDEQIHVLSDGSTAVILPKVRDSPASAYWLASRSILVEVVVPNSPENSDVGPDEIRRFLELLT